MIITEEKLQNFLNDLRTGKYDTDRYLITTDADQSMTILDNQTKVSVTIKCIIPKPAYSERKRFSFKVVEPITVFTVNLLFSDPTISGHWIITDVDYNLYSSFVNHIKERREQDKLILDSKIEASFDL